MLALAQVSLLVRDYDEAIGFFTQRLGFALVEDAALEGGKRWVVVAPPGRGCALLLARAATPQQHAAVGQQGGGRVFLFLHTPDIDAERTRMEGCGVHFLEPTRTEAYGRVAVFQDLYGGRWDLIEPTAAPDESAADLRP